MEELDLLKKDWKKNENKFPKVSEKEIYGMLHKNSTSIVKWIFLISIFEFTFFLCLTLLLNDSKSTVKMEEYIGRFTFTAITVIDYAITLCFFYLFYINYKKISTTDRVKNLMTSILKTRKTVYNYIFVKIGFTVVLAAATFILYFYNEPQMISARHIAEEQGRTAMLYAITIAVILISIAFFAVAIWLFYRLIYGLLLKKLKKNYDELKKIDF